MNELLLLFLSLSVSGSLLALIMFVLKPLIKNRLGQTWQYYIWLIVVLRFLLPFTSNFSVVGGAVQYIQNAAVAPVEESTSYYSAFTTEYDFMPPADDALPPLPLTMQDTGDEAAVPAGLPIDILSNAWMFWLGISVILLVRKVTSYRGFIRNVRAGAHIVTDPNILNVYKDVCAEARINKPLPLYNNNYVASPMLVGFVRPMIVIPHLDITKAELQHVFRHELTHYRRLDIFYKWMVQIIICLHWFNPLVYLMSREINRKCELSCDENIVKSMDKEGRLTYGDTLVTSLKAEGNYGDMVVSISLSENAALLKERLSAILRYSTKSRLASMFSVVLAIAMLCGAMFTGAYAASANSKFNRMGSLSQSFEKYIPFGVSYNAEQAAVFYNGERVKLFVDFNVNKEKDMPHPFDLSYSDSDIKSTLYLEAVKDADGKITGIRELDKAIARDLLDNMNTVLPQNLPESVRYIKMDGTQTIEKHEIVGKDIVKDMAPQDIKDWMRQCDQKQGAYVTTSQSESGYITYIYYNGGGRYPWDMDADNDSIRVEMFSDRGLATSDGYYLMYFTSPGKYENISLRLDETELKIEG